MEKKKINKDDFKHIIKLASQPIKQDLKKSGKKKAYNYSGKQTRQRNVADTSGKRNGKSH